MMKSRIQCIRKWSVNRTYPTLIKYNNVKLTVSKLKEMGGNPSKQAGFGSFAGSVDQDIDQPYRRGSSDADSNCRKMGQSQRRVEEGGFEGGGVSSKIK